jgi:hypothetical protein
MIHGFTRVPSARRLAKHLGLTTEKAKELRAVLKGEKSPDDYASVQAWQKQCYSLLPWLDKALCAADEIMEQFGVEPIHGETYWSAYWGDIVALYINTGETYDATLVVDVRDKTLQLTSWGDYVERHS